MNHLWVRQVIGMLRLELKKNLFSFRAVPIYLLAGLPVAFVALVVVVSLIAGAPPELESAAGVPLFYAHIYQFVLRLVIFFGCVWIFVNLFRGEVLDRSLHYYFLTPVRREVLVAGKYISAVISVSILLCCSTLVSFVAIYAFPGSSGILQASAIGHLIAYLGVTALACLGYGAMFLLVGLFFKNPLVPALIIFLWEGLNPLLPGLLKKISLIFYLQSLFPVPIPEGPFAVIVEPVSAWIGVPGLLLFTALILLVAGFRIRGMEIAYGSD